MVEVADRRDPVLQAMARNALDFMIKDRTDEAGAVLQRLADRYGGDGAVEAALLWIDTLGAHFGHRPDGARVALLLKEVESGQVGTVDGGRPTVVWAGRLIAARFADDEATFSALINAAACSPSFGAHIGELLHMVALSLEHGQVLAPGQPVAHLHCRTLLRTKMADLGTDVSVLTEPPPTKTPYAQPPMTCPHGTTYWLEPTPAQIAAWERDGVE